MKFDFAMLERHVADLKARHCYSEAEALLRPFVRSGLRAPIPIWRLLAGVLRQQGKIDETRRIQEMLVTSTPEDYACRCELAETLLLQGEFERGWREYRYRYNLPHTNQRMTQCPRWDGEPISGKTLLVLDEQGHADNFQFLRMIPWARERSGARVVLQINPEQLPLAARAGGFDEIISREQSPPASDVQCELLSLPTALNLRLQDLPGPIPYLSAAASLVEHWRTRLASLPRPWVGLNCVGMSPADLAPPRGSGITFISLQQGETAEEIRNFEDMAAVLTLFDLLIATDSSPVHLAGALGRPVWVLLSFVHDWRWLLSRTDTPWYPTARLFRQSAPRDWEPVSREVAAELGRFCATAPAGPSAQPTRPPAHHRHPAR